MYKLKVKKKKEKKLIGNKIRYYVDFVILACCLIIAINIHPSKISNNFVSNAELNNPVEKTKMIYVFHDYEGNEFIMNDNIHGASSSWDYLFDDEVPDDLKGDGEDAFGSVSIGDLSEDSRNDNNEDWDQKNDSEQVKDNQVSIEDIMSDLGITDSDADDETINGIANEEEIMNSDLSDSSLDIDAGNYESEDNLYDDIVYVVVEKTGSGKNSLIIEKFDDNRDYESQGDYSETIDNGDIMSNENIKSEIEINDTENNSLLVAKSFTFIDEGWVLPTLVPWNDLFFGETDQALAYIDGTTSSEIANNGYANGNDTKDESKKSGITIIGDYADCMTPWGYKIKHGDSVLAYKQMDNAPNICNIERRFCWKGKLSGTYTQQGCSINENYSYEQRGDTDVHTIKRGSDSSSSSSTQGGAKSSTSKEDFEGRTRQNEDGSVSVKNDEIGSSFVFDRPNNMYTDFTGDGDNVRPEDSEVELYFRPHRDCTTPRGEKVKDGQFVQAFKHKNGFNDIPCETQFRLCTVGDLMGTFTESSCKTWDTSFIDWVYGSPTRQTYSEEKLELIKKQLKNEEKDYNKDRKKIGKLSNNDDFDELLYILDDNY